MKKISIGMSMLVCLSLTACNDPKPKNYQGYVEGEFLYLAAPKAGYMRDLVAERGKHVNKGDILFIVAEEPDLQALMEAKYQALAVKQKLINLEQPRRTNEIAALQANLLAAEAQERLAAIQLNQQERLFKQKYVAEIRVDEARNTHTQAIAQIQAINKQLADYRSTIGRKAEIESAEAELFAANAKMEQLQWSVEHKTMTAPTTGEIYDTYYRPGEWVGAGSAVASLLPDHRRRIRFFIPETALSNTKIGQSILANCDACQSPIEAKIDYISAKAEYTPPVIYSRGSREKLVFRVEAAPTGDQFNTIRPGLPVDVQLKP